MKWFKHLTVGKKLIFGFTTMVVVMSIIGFAGYQSTVTINRNLGKIFAVNLPSINYLLQADRDLQQLLVAERSMIFSNAKSDIFKNFVKEYEENLKQSQERWEKYKALAATAEEKAVFTQYENARKEWQAISKRVVDGRVADTREGRREALDLTLGQAKAKFEEMRNYLDQLTGINLKVAEDAHHAADETYSKTLTFLFSVMGAGLVIGLLMMWGLTQGITKPLKNVISTLNQSSEQVSSASGQISSASQSLAEGSSEQAASIEETSSSLEEMSSMTRQNADNASQADGLMKEANQVVAQANESMTQLTGSMQEITKASEETSKIIKTIDEIAFQTNLLALNAAVEAARAGEAGAGFAVVADEVRNLAMRAAESAKDTAALIEGTVKKVNDGSELVTRTNEAFTQVAGSTSKVGELIGEIAAASNEQAQGIEQVNTAVSEMDKVTQTNAANAEESASASEEMSAQSEQLKAMVNELLIMVGGRSNFAARKRHEIPENPGTGKDTAAAMKSPEETAKSNAIKDRQTKGVSAEQLIPLGEEDFNDF